MTPVSALQFRIISFLSFFLQNLIQCTKRDTQKEIKFEEVKTLPAMTKLTKIPVFFLSTSVFNVKS